METTVTNHADAPTRSFYLPALGSRSGGPGRIERFLTSLYQRHRTYLRRME